MTFVLHCGLCPKNCLLAEHQTGFCGVRTVKEGQIVLLSGNKSTGIAVDPIEKKPLNHFYPGTSVLSFGGIGCNLACRFCQNAATAQSHDLSLLRTPLTPRDVAALAEKYQCKSAAFTYNEPIIAAEFVQETARQCRQAGLKTVAVSNGYIAKERRKDFFDVMDAANIDLKSFSDSFYREYCAGTLEPVKETLRYLAKSDTWLEITTLLIPSLNDSEQELIALTRWLAKEIGKEVPLHFSAYHPAHQLRDIPPTVPQTLFRAREIALANGLRYVYTGNIDDPAGQTTVCPQCGQAVISRSRYTIDDYQIDGESCCKFCGQTICGCFDDSGE